jgi:hypothetical protein
VRPSAIIQRMFVWTFGERHLGLKCVRRSIVATALVAIISSCIFYTVVAKFLRMTIEPLFSYQPVQVKT